MYSRFRGQRLPIDYFLASLAQDQRQFAIGIIFSGTGNSWTLTLAFKPKLQRHYVRPNSVNLDVVVTDYNMPGLSGLDIARQVREIRQDLPVIVSSGLIDQELHAHADEAGVRAFIPKPFSAKYFCDLVKQLLSDPIG